MVAFAYAYAYIYVGFNSLFNQETREFVGSAGYAAWIESWNSLGSKYSIKAL